MKKHKWWIVLSAVALVVLAMLLFARGLWGGDDQDAEKIAKALADRLGGKLGFEGKGAASGDSGFIVKCRGGQVPVRIVFIHRGDGRVVPAAVLSFRRGWRAAGLKGEHLLPGECAWIDRGLRPDEHPNVLLYGFDTQVSFTPQPGGGGYRVDVDARSSRPGAKRPWQRNFFHNFARGDFVTEFRVHRRGNYLVCGEEY